MYGRRDSQSDRIDAAWIAGFFVGVSVAFGAAIAVWVGWGR